MWEILFRYQDFVAINKPQGISVHRSGGEVSLTATLAAQLGVEKVWLLHRLDKQAGGILLFALNPQSAAVLAAQFAERKMKKTYLALSDRKPSKKQGWIKGGMEKSRRGMWKLTRNMENIAVTRFFSIRISEKMRLFILEPHTGKTHQLRVVMKSLGSSIFGGQPVWRNRIRNYVPVCVKNTIYLSTTRNRNYRTFEKCMAGRKYLSCTGRILYGKSRLIDINQLKQYDKYFYKIFSKNG